MSKNLLFVVAINSYKSSRYSTLNNAVSDAKRLINTLEERYHFKEQNYLFNSDATTKEITNALVELKHLTEDDNLIFFFSGHGTQDPDTGKAQLVPTNAENRSDLISFSLIKAEYLECVKAKHILIIFDCCYSANFISKTRGSNSNSKITDKPSRYLLASGGEEKVSDGKKGHESPFMKYLLSFLQDNNKAHFLTTELATFIRENVGEAHQQQPIYEPIPIDGHVTGGEFGFTLKRAFVEDSPENFSYKYDCPEINPDFVNFLEDPGVVFYHRQADEVLLSDIFVEPNLKEVEVVLEAKEKKTRSLPKKLWSIFENLDTKGGMKLIFTGEETSGKTTVSKRIFEKLYNESYIPVYINVEESIREVRKEKFLRTVKKEFEKQYQNCDFESVELNSIVIILDDFHKFKSPKKRDFKDALVKNIASVFNNIILVGDVMMHWGLITQDNKLKNTFVDFRIYQLLEFGPKLRKEVIVRWHSIGEDVSLVDKNDLFRRYDEQERQIQSIIGKNVLPTYPFYILTIIQNSETFPQQKPQYSQHGFYYEYLINQQLAHSVKNSEDISLYYNYLMEFAYFLFDTKQKAVSISEFEKFHQLYSDKYDINYSSKAILVTLRDSKLLVVNSSVSIKRKYVYYFFVAKFLSDNLQQQKVIEIITKMCKRVYRDEYSNVIIFLTHLSKEPIIVESILSNAQSIFKDQRIATFSKDVQGINKLLKELPSQVIELVESEDVRDDELAEKEELETLEKEFDIEKDDYYEYDLDESTEDLNLLGRMNLALRTIEILGEITKKYWGSMDANTKFALATETYSLGLRALNKYLSFVQSHPESIAQFVKELLQRNNKNKNVNESYSLTHENEETINNFIFRLCFLSSYGIVKRVSNSIGYPKLYNTLNKVLAENNENSIKLIDLSIHLDFDSIDIDRLKKMEKEFEKNFLPYFILRQLVNDRIYYFDEDYKTIQKISEIFSMSISDQRKISGSSVEKKR